MCQVAWGVKTQDGTSQSTAVSELDSIDHHLKHCGIPSLDLWEVLLDRKDLSLTVCEDNEAAIKIIKKGYSPALRWVHRVRRLNLGWLNEVFQNAWLKIQHTPSPEMRADPFTKTIAPSKWAAALELLGLQRGKKVK